MASCMASAPSLVASSTTLTIPPSNSLAIPLIRAATLSGLIVHVTSAIIPHLLVDLTLEGSLERVRRIHYLRDFVYVILQHRIQRRVSNPHLHAHSNIKIIGYRYLHTNVLYRRRITR